jgi:hypothetical protein
VRRALTAAAAAAVLLAGCGGGQSDEEAMVQTIRTSILRDQTFAGYEVSGEEATCVAEATVTGLGAERLSEIGFDADDADRPDEVDLRQLSDGEIGVIGAAMDECIEDIDQVLVDTVTRSILEDPAPTLPIDEDEATCVAEQVVGEIPARRLIAIGVRGDRAGGAELRPAEVDVFASAYTDCIDVRDILIQGIASAGTASEQVLACLDENIADEDIETIFRAGLAGEDAGATARRLLAPAVDTCTGRV